MAIVKVGTYRNPPEDITDYEAIVAHLEAYTRQVGSQAMILTEWTNTSGTPAIALGSYISHGGVLYVAESEEAVALPVADGTYYLKVAASGESLALSWVSDISGYAWNAIYNGLYHADKSQVLPYMLIKTGTSIEKWRITNIALGTASLRINYLGSLRGTDFDQPLKTTDSPTFDKLCIDSLLHKYPDFGSGNVKTLTSFQTLSATVARNATTVLTSDIYTIQWSDYVNNVNPINFLSEMGIYSMMSGRYATGSAGPPDINIKVDVKIDGVIVATVNKTNATQSELLHAYDLQITFNESHTLQYIVTITAGPAGPSTTYTGEANILLMVERNFTGLEALSN